MATTVEDLDVRVSALEKAAEREKSVERAVSEIVSKSETRLRERFQDLQAETAKLRTEITRIDDRISGSEARIVSQINDSEQRILAALDKLANPPK